MLHFARQDEMVHEVLEIDESRDELQRSQEQHDCQNLFARPHLLLRGLHWFRSTKYVRYLVLRLIVAERYYLP